MQAPSRGKAIVQATVAAYFRRDIHYYGGYIVFRQSISGKGAVVRESVNAMPRVNKTVLLQRVAPDFPSLPDL